MSNNNNNNNGVPMQTYNREQSTFKMIKYHVFILVLIGILALVLFLASRFSEESIPIIIFFALLLIPLMIGFKDSLPDYIPSFLRNFIVTESELRPSEAVAIPQVTTKTKEIYMTVAMAVISILLIILIIEIRPNLNNNVTGQELFERNISTKIISGVLLASFLGVLTINFDKMHKLEE